MVRIFMDRIEAAEELARRLEAYRGRNPLILAIPRGAVPMGQVLTDRLQGELDVVLVRKIGMPSDPEYALGAVDEMGYTYPAPASKGDPEAERMLEELKLAELATIRERRARYTPFTHAIDPHARIAIVVDDGLATGATMTAALQSVRRKHPAELVCAVPVAALSSLEDVAPLATKVVCLHAYEDFVAVGRYYRRFDQVDDQQVIDILSRGVGADNMH